MNKILPIIAMLLFGMFIMSSGCHYTPSGPPAVKKTPSLSDTGLSGTSWKWLSSSGGFAGVFISPDKRGYNVSIQFASDSLFSFFRNDTLVETAQYNVSADTDGQPFYAYHISLQNIVHTQYQSDYYPGSGYFNEFVAWLALQGDTLTIQQKVADGYTDRFVLIP